MHRSQDSLGERSASRSKNLDMSGLISGIDLADVQLDCAVDIMLIVKQSAEEVMRLTLLDKLELSDRTGLEVLPE